MRKKEVVILIAEDDKGHFVLAKNYLKRRGLRNKIIWFADGSETLDFFLNSEGPDRSDDEKQYVLLLDIRMPGLDGIEVLKRMKQNLDTKKVPVIMLTTTDNPHEIERCYKLGCSAYIVKPVRYAKYIDAMRKVGLFPSAVEKGFVLLSKNIA